MVRGVWVAVAGHPLTQLIVVVIAGMAVSAVFGLFRALRGPVGVLAYAGLIATLYAYWRMGDRYFSQGVWEISIACLVVMWIALYHVPWLRIVLALAVVEFGSRINKTSYPQETLVGLGLAAAMFLVATFWAPKEPKAPDAPRDRAVPRLSSRPRSRASRGPRRQGAAPRMFDPYGRSRPQAPARPQRNGWVTISALVDRARGRSRSRR